MKVYNVKAESSHLTKFKHLEERIRTLSNMFKTNGQRVSEEQVEAFVQEAESVRLAYEALVIDSLGRFELCKPVVLKAYCENCEELQPFSIKEKEAIRPFLKQEFKIQEKYAGCDVCSTEVYHEPTANETLGTLAKAYRERNLK